MKLEGGQMLRCHNGQKIGDCWARARMRLVVAGGTLYIGQILGRWKRTPPFGHRGRERAMLIGVLRGGSVVLLILVTVATAAAQPFPGLDCPGRWVPYGGGVACQCANGMLANMVGNRVVCPTAHETQGEREQRERAEQQRVEQERQRIEQREARERAEEERSKAELEALRRAEETQERARRASQEAERQRAEKERLAREVAEREQAAERARKEREQEERRLAELRDFTSQLGGCRRFVVTACDGALRSAHATEDDRRNLAAWRAAATQFEIDRDACKTGSAAGCDAALASAAASESDRRSLREWRAEASAVHRSIREFSRLWNNALTHAQSLRASFAGLPTSTHIALAVDVALAVAIVFYLTRLRGRGGGGFNTSSHGALGDRQVRNKNGPLPLALAAVMLVCAALALIWFGLSTAPEERRDEALREGLPTALGNEARDTGKPPGAQAKSSSEKSRVAPVTTEPRRDTPSEADARQAFERQLTRMIKPPYALESFRKLDGVNQSFMGVSLYRMEVLAVVKYEGNEIQCVKMFCPFALEWGFTDDKANKRLTLRGYVNFEKTENGWGSR